MIDILLTSYLSSYSYLIFCLFIKHFIRLVVDFLCITIRVHPKGMLVAGYLASLLL